MEVAKKYAPGFVKTVKMLCVIVLIVGFLYGLIDAVNTIEEMGELGIRVLSAMLRAVGLSVVIWIDGFVACEFFALAVDKGYTRSTYLWICFLLTIIGYFLIIATPNMKSNTHSQEVDLKTAIGRIAKLVDLGVLSEDEASAMKANIIERL